MRSLDQKYGVLGSAFGPFGLDYVSLLRAPPFFLRRLITRMRVLICGASKE